MIFITLLRAQALFRFKLLLFSRQYAPELAGLEIRHLEKCVLVCVRAGLQRSLLPRVSTPGGKLAAVSGCCEGTPPSEDNILTTFRCCFVPSLFSWRGNSRLAGKLLSRHTTEPEGLPIVGTGQGGKLKFQKLHKTFLETCWTFINTALPCLFWVSIG